MDNGVRKTPYPLSTIHYPLHFVSCSRRNTIAGMRSILIACVCWVCLTSFATAALAAESHEVSIANLQFKPASISIKAGDTIVWTNNDDRDHTVISTDGTFASDTIRRGESFSFKFDKPGKFTYGCKLHPRMKGVVIVLAQK